MTEKAEEKKEEKVEENKSPEVKVTEEPKEVKEPVTNTEKPKENEQSKENASKVLSPRNERGRNRGQNRIRSRFQKRERKARDFDRSVVSIRRVTKVRAGSKRLRFSVAVVVGDRNGKVGFGLGRALNTKSAVDKAAKKAQNSLVKVPLRRGTIPHEVTFAKGASRIVIKPAGPGTGVIAGSSVRAVMEICGVHNVLTKVLGTNDPIQNAICAIEALKQLKTKGITRREFEAPVTEKKQFKKISKEVAKPTK